MKCPTHILVLISVLICYAISGQEDCSKALIQDMYAQVVNKSSALHYLNIIDESTYNKAKKDGGFGVKIPFNGLPLGGDANFSDFSEWRKKTFREENFSYDTDYSSSILSKTVSPSGYKSYDNCINMTSKLPGLFMNVIDSDKKYVTIEIYYKSGLGSNHSIEIESDLKNGEISGVEGGKIFSHGYSIEPNHTIRRIITRKDPKEVVTGTLNAGGFATSFKVNGYIPPIPPPLCKPEIIKVDANSYRSGSINICDNCHGYGVGIISNNSPAVQENRALYSINFNCSGRYDVEIYYTAAQKRPIQVSLNDKIINSNACGNVTGGWHAQTLRWVNVGVVDAKKGTNIFELYRNNVFPHIRSVRFIPKN